MKNKLLLMLMALTILSVYSCKKDIGANESQINGLSNSSNQESKVLIAKTLAKAVAEEPLLRTFLKEEAKKQFDNDYDILFQMIKDNKLSDNSTVYEKISKHSDSKDNFDKSLNENPLLTIFVPVLPNFSADTWNAASQVPIVAIKGDDRISDVVAYDSKYKTTIIKYGEIPGFPVIVLKDNERVSVNTPKGKIGGLTMMSKNATLIKGSDEENQFLNKNGMSFSFTSEAFNNTKAKNLKSNLKGSVPYKTMRIVDSASLGAITIGDRGATVDNTKPQLDPICLLSLKSKNQWHRDYVYYGIDSSNNITQGAFRNNYSEFITKFKILDNNFGKIADGAGDPTPTYENATPGSRGNPINYPYGWTDGAFEFRVNVLIVNKNGSPSEYLKVFSARPDQLFSIKYRFDSNERKYFVEQIVSNDDFYPNIELFPWDLDLYGTSWKFVVSEYDPSQEITNTFTHTSTFTNNFQFSVSLGTVVKLGPQLSNGISTSNSTTYSVKTTVGSDVLGDGVLDFRSPIITGTDIVTNNRGGVGFTKIPVYKTYEVTTGSVSMAIEPRKIY